MPPEQKVRAKVAKLASRFNRLTHADIVIAAPNRVPHNPKIYSVRITLGMPGRPDLVVASGSDSHNEHHDLPSAIRDAFDVAERRLGDSVERLRGEVKTHAIHGNQ